MEQDAEKRQDLEGENQRLLNELEGLYRQVESHLLASEQERDIAYQELRERNAQLERMNDDLFMEIGRRREAEDRIQDSLQEKEVLLKEIHHRVKNNLQIISSLLNLQRDRHPQVESVFQESQGRIQAMALIHERLYQSEDLARVDFGDYLRTLIQYLARSYGRRDVAVDLETEGVSLNLDVAVSCGLIVHELCSNALKYAFPDGQSGRIRILFTQEIGGACKLVVMDDGIGFPSELDFQNTESLGLQLVMTLSRQLDGVVALERREGTRFKVSFPG